LLTGTMSIAVVVFVAHAVARPKDREEPVEDAVAPSVPAARPTTRRWSVP
jgi:hypothetical protein